VRAVAEMALTVSARRGAHAMTDRPCVVCGEPLQSWARADKSTCSPACRSRLCRTRKVSRNTFATPLEAVALRSGGQASTRAVSGQTGSPGALREASPRPTNPVIFALVVALRDVEQRRARGNVLTDPTAKEPTP
jgi:predicted nucleic acid-binding Zn ribbon protein